MDGDGPKKQLKAVDFCNLTPYERQRVKDAWLSVPKPYHPAPYADAYSLVRKTPFGLSVPALKAKCSRHTEMLATAKDPLPSVHYITKAEREIQKELEEEMTKEELRWLKRKPIVFAPSGVSKAALSGKTTPRIDAMAIPNLGALMQTKRLYFHKLNQNQRNALNKNIQEHLNMFSANYPPESDKIYVIVGGSLVHKTCSGKPKEGEKRVRYLCELSKNQRKMFRKRMKQMGLPKKKIQSDKGPDRGPKKKIKDMEPWLATISQPRYNILNEKPYDPFKVRSSAKVYVASERVIVISKPKPVPPPPPLLDMNGNELPPRKEWSFRSRQRIIATQRTIELANPKFVKKKVAEDVKDDPFAVVRRALTAYCSPRIKELALPVRR